MHSQDGEPEMITIGRIPGNGFLSFGHLVEARVEVMLVSEFNGR